MQRSRDLLWDGLLNVRDLGGHPTEDGGETRYDSIIRADSVRQLSDQGWAALVDYGVKTIVDLRTNDELAADPPAELPVEVLHIPFFETDADDWKEVEARLEAITRSAADVPSATREVYLIFLEHFSRNVAAAIRAIADAPEGGVGHPLRRRQGSHRDAHRSPPARGRRRHRTRSPRITRSARSASARGTSSGSPKPTPRKSSSG